VLEIFTSGIKVSSKKIFANKFISNSEATNEEVDKMCEDEIEKIKSFWQSVKNILNVQR
jgi:hypothetical protein